MPADETQHHLFVCLSAAVSADRTQVNRRIYFVLWFFIRLQFRADEYEISAQQQAVNRWQQYIMTVEISKLIDERNETLWNEIVSKYQVDVQASPNSEYSCYFKSDNVTFFVPLDNYCPDSFTHELLHVYIRLKEVFIGSNLIFRISASKVLQRIFNDKLLEHVANCLDHIKMLPIYLQMGFRRDKFLLDYHDDKCTERELSDIKQYYKIGNHYNTQAVEIFIGKFLAVKADPNETYDYKNCLTKLKKIDERLFIVLNNFVTSWMQYDLDSNDIFNSYRDLVDKFYDGLKSWMTGKEFN